MLEIRTSIFRKISLAAFAAHLKDYGIEYPPLVSREHAVIAAALCERGFLAIRIDTDSGQLLADNCAEGRTVSAPLTATSLLEALEHLPLARKDGPWAEPAERIREAYADFIETYSDRLAANPKFFDNKCPWA